MSDVPTGIVKPLEWENFGLEMWADGIVGRYFISGHNGNWAWSFDDEDSYLHGLHASDEASAKAAAQADYERRILSALNLDALLAAAVREGVGMGMKMAKQADVEWTAVAYKSRHSSLKGNLACAKASACAELKDLIRDIASDEPAIAEAVARVKGRNDDT